MSRAGAIITYGDTSLGIQNSGELNFIGLGPGGPGLYGVYRAGVGDAISPGCACEGWGVSVSTAAGPTSGFANQSSGSGGLTGGSFGSTPATATSIIGLSGAPVTVEHRYGPSLQTDIFQVNVRVTNTGAEALNDLTYRRAMDWDVPPTEFSEFVTHAGVSANLTTNGGNVQFASDNGFANSNPLLSADSILPGTVNQDFVDSGPADHGSVFDFYFGTLDVGATREFNIYYGSKASEAAAVSALSALGVNVYSLGQNSDPGGSTAGTPATFLFAFGGVGGVEPGTDPSVPILPFVPAPDTFEFPAPLPRRWYDPPFSSSFDVTLTGGALFTSLELPPAATHPFGPVSIVVGGVTLATLPMGSPFTFAIPTSSFSIVGLTPGLDLASPGLATAFPLFLDFTGTATSMTWTFGVDEFGEIPEPQTVALMAIGLAGIFSLRRKLAA